MGPSMRTYRCVASQPKLSCLQASGLGGHLTIPHVGQLVARLFRVRCWPSLWVRFLCGRVVGNPEVIQIGNRRISTDNSANEMVRRLDHPEGGMIRLATYT